MRLSSTSARWLRASTFLIAALVTGAAVRAQSFGNGANRFIDLVELEDHDDQADIVIQFNCSLRYLTHQPTSEAKELRIQLQPTGDCGVQPGALIAGELPPLSGGANIIDAVRVNADVPGQVTLDFSFRKTERYVIAQSANLRSLRLRLIDRARGRGKIMVNEPSGAVNSYAVNLEAQPADFKPQAVQLAKDRLKVAIFVSQAVVDGVTWYRLRAGPLAKRADADKLLNAALADYPRAWLAIGDDTATTSEGAGEALPAVERIGADPALDAATRDKLVADARAAMTAHDYPKAIGLLTKLQRQPEFPQRAAMQELLGLARERSGQLAHAKAEYEEYLHRYLNGEAAERVARRLVTLRAASTNGQTGTRNGGGQSGQGWSLSGGFGQTFRYDGTTVNNTVTTATLVPTANQTAKQSNDSLYNDADLLARRRGERFDFIARTSVGYAKNFAGASATAASNSNKRVSVASLEIDDRQWGLLARIGRQSQNLDGALGAFDGLYAAWQIKPAIGLNFTTGFPVEQTNVGIKTARKFWAVAVPYTPVGKHWDASVFFTQWRFDTLTDRRAVGLQARLLLPRSSLTGFVDYDTFYKSLNTATILGTLQLPARWNLSFDAERRNAPVLTTRNALIGQPFTRLSQLLDFDVNTLGIPVDQATEMIYRDARNNTPLSTNYSLTATKPLGQRFQFATTVSAQKLGATTTTGSQVPLQEATGLQLAYQAQVFGSNIWREGDFTVLSAAYSNTQSGKLASLGVTTRTPIGGAWRLGPRLTVDRQQLASDSSISLSFIPSVLLDYQRGRRLLQFEAGGQIGRRSVTQQIQSTTAQQTQNTKRYYVSLAYRIGF